MVGPAVSPVLDPVFNSLLSRVVRPSGRASRMTAPDAPRAKDGLDAAALFTGKGADYEVARPGYPPALLDALPPARDIADVGAGTGLLTAALIERGACVTAIEPNADMRAVCDRRLGHHPGYASLPGSAEATGLPDASVDLLTAAQAFHWFDPVPARREALRILRPGGEVALLWNDRAEDPLQRALDAVFDEFGGGRRGAMLARDDRAAVPDFFGSRTRQFVVAHVQALDRAGLEALAFSRSYMPPRGTAEGRAAVGALAALFSRFSVGGQVAMRYDAVLILGRPAG